MTRLVLVGLMWSLAPNVAWAHEAWLVAGDGGVSLATGEDFTGEPRPLRRERTASLRRYVGADAGEVAWPMDAGALAAVPVGSAGLISWDSQPSLIELSGDEFTAYLREDGLAEALADRADAGQSKLPGRERYRRCLKVLLQPGAFAVKTGQALELVPQSEPLTPALDAVRPFVLLLQGKPLSGARVRAWSWRGPNLVTISGRTGTDGVARFELPHAGRWMISTVHMMRLTAVKEADWESFWASLTFDVPARVSP
jgi:hypothetical protein